MHEKIFCWGFLLGIRLLPIRSANAKVDDTLEQIGDASEELLRTDKSDYTDRKFPPLRLTIKEEIEWGDFDDAPGGQDGRSESFERRTQHTRSEGRRGTPRPA